MKKMEPINKALRIESERLLLRPVTEEDTDTLLAIRNAEYVKQYFFYRTDITREVHLDYLHNKCETGEVHYLVVIEKETDSIIGVVYLQHYDEKRNAMESGFFYAEKSPKGKGYATEAYRLLAGYAFEDLKLDLLFCRIMLHNSASIRVNEKIGYVITGTEYESTTDGESIETAILELTKEAFYEKN